MRPGAASSVTCTTAPSSGSSRFCCSCGRRSGAARAQRAPGRVEAGLEGTLEELREYARGVHPAILTDGGLAPALRALARRSPVPVTLQVHLPGRLPGHAEVTAYYLVSEALGNAARHAGASAGRAGAAGDILRLAVVDDGTGGADPARGSGLAGLRDRVEATGGTLRIRSRPGEGTTLLAELPARPGPPATAGRTARSSSSPGQRRPDGGNGGRARTRVPQPGKRAPPDSAYAARPARLRLRTGRSPARAPFAHRAGPPRVPGTVALARPYTGLRYLARCATAEARTGQSRLARVARHNRTRDGQRACLIPVSGVVL
jgi:histidine kinase/DNA gyrase B/HSP90-like ATPase